MVEDVDERQDEVEEDREEPEDKLSSSPLFRQMLKEQEGQVHFLYFWRAYSVAVNLCRSLDDERGSTDKGLALELETLRDSLLRVLEAQAGGAVCHDGLKAKGERMVTAAELAMAIRGTAAMSVAPAFWRTVLETLFGVDARRKFTVEELPSVIIAWLSDAIVFESREAPSAAGATDEKKKVEPAVERQRESEGLAVYLHVYDVSKEERVRRLNKVLAHRNSPLKFGGAFHVGVEVAGLEWSFGFTTSETTSGIACTEPRAHPFHHFRQTVRLKQSKLSAEEVVQVLGELVEEYPGYDYDLLRRNCCDFANDFSQRLGAGGIPAWIGRLARLGACVDGVLRKMPGRSGRGLVPADILLEDPLTEDYDDYDDYGY
jgi:hypothetical protein